MGVDTKKKLYSVNLTARKGCGDGYYKFTVDNLDIDDAIEVYKGITDNINNTEDKHRIVDMPIDDTKKPSGYAKHLIERVWVEEME